MADRDMALIRTALALNTLVIDAMALLAGHHIDPFVTVFSVESKRHVDRCEGCGLEWPCPTRLWMDRAEALTLGR